MNKLYYTATKFNEENMEHYYSVIMAGGVGKRFWPLSRKKHPKQLLDIVGSKSMINLTIDRLKTLSDIDHIFIMTNHRTLWKKHRAGHWIGGSSFA